MWRDNGIQYYRYVLLFVILLEVLVIVTVTSILLMRAFASLNSDTLIQTVLTVGILTMLAVIINLFVYTLFFHLRSKQAEARYQQSYLSSLDTWTEAFFSEEIPTDMGVNRATASALVSFAEALSDEDAPQLHALSKETGVTAFWSKELHARTTYRKVDALNALSVLGDESVLNDVMDYLSSDILIVRAAAAKAVARLIAHINGDLRTQTLYVLGDTLCQTRLPTVIINEIYITLDIDARILVGYLLQQNTIPVPALIATIDAIGTYHFHDLASMLAGYLDHDSVNLRLAILRAFDLLNNIPNNAFRQVLACSRDTVPRVREQAVSTLVSTPLYQTRLLFWLALGDDDWWVRYTAGNLLHTHHGERGRQILRTASQKHESAEGRIIAAEILSHAND